MAIDLLGDRLEFYTCEEFENERVKKALEELEKVEDRKCVFAGLIYESDLSEDDDILDEEDEDEDCDVFDEEDDDEDEEDEETLKYEDLGDHPYWVVRQAAILGYVEDYSSTSIFDSKKEAIKYYEKLVQDTDMDLHDGFERKYDYKREAYSPYLVGTLWKANDGYSHVTVTLDGAC